MRGIALFAVAAVAYHFLTEVWLWVLLPAFPHAYNIVGVAMIAALLTVLAIAVSASRLGSRVTRMRQFRSTASPTPPTSVQEYGDQVRTTARQFTWTRTILGRGVPTQLG